MSEETKELERLVSFSQFSMYAACPRRWKLSYIDKLKTNTQSIHTLFGTSIHETLQQWLEVMYNESVEKSEHLELDKILIERLKYNYIKSIEGGQEEYTTDDELRTFAIQGIEILKHIKANRAKYFDPVNYELVGIELQLKVPILENNNVVKMYGFVDVVFRHKTSKEILILDIKTSGKGWGSYDFGDTVKTSQLHLYKKYYAKQYNVPESKINVKYFIVKRQLDESTGSTDRVQEYVPNNRDETKEKIFNKLLDFVSTAFNEDGSYNTDFTYPALTGYNGKNCKFCEFKDSAKLCPTIIRK